MKNYKTTFYGFNVACKNDIVYPSVTGEIIRISADDFGSKEEF